MIIWGSVCCRPPPGSLDFILPTDFNPIDINFLMLTFMNVVKWPYHVRTGLPACSLVAEHLAGAPNDCFLSKISSEKKILP